MVFATMEWEKIRAFRAGRYAPSPTGALHLGNLRTAVAAWADARSRGEGFLLRIEDLDRARSRPAFAEQQLIDLRQLGLDWDADPLYQSARDSVYTEAFEQLCRAGHVYPCFCSRKEVAEASQAPHGQVTRYPGTCARLAPELSAYRIAAGEQHCWRLRVPKEPVVLNDLFAGTQLVDLDLDGGDFVIRRADGLFAYQLACAVDDALSGITRVVRGNDLLPSAVRQQTILRFLDLPVPEYLHLPLLRRADGERLSKRAGDEAMGALVRRGIPPEGIFSWLAWTLGQATYGEWISVPELLRRWTMESIPREDFLFTEESLSAYMRPAGGTHERHR